MRYLWYIFVITVLVSSCKEDEIPFFEGRNGVNFWQNGGTSANVSTVRVYSFTAAANAAKDRDTIFFDMQVSGKLENYPRTISIRRVEEGSTARAGVDYDFPAEVTLPAGEHRVQYPVYIYRTPQMEVDTMTLVIEPIETDDFIVGATGPIPPACSSCGHPTVWLYNQASLIISDILPRPSTWSDAIFGAFSSVKLRFMMEVTGLTNFSASAIGATGAIELPIALRAALAAHEAANGPLLDENGVRVTF